MPAILALLGVAFTIWAAVTAVQRGQTQPWLWLILVFGPLGATIYLLSEYLPASRRFHVPSRRASAADVARAEADVQRLDTADAWSEYASALLSRGKLEEAEKASEEALRRDSSRTDAWYTLGGAALRRKRTREATAAFEEVVRRDPGYRSGDAMYALAHAQHESGDEDAARTTLEELAGRSSRPEVLYDLAALQINTGHTDAAKKSLQRIVDEAQYAPSYAMRQIRPWVRKAQKTLASLP